MLHWHRLQTLRLGRFSFADSAMGWLSLTEQAAEVRNPETAQGDMPGFICQRPCFSTAWIHHVDPREVANEGLQVAVSCLAREKLCVDTTVLSCLQKSNGEVFFVVPVRSNKKRGENLLGHLVHVAVSHSCTSFPCRLRRPEVIWSHCYGLSEL